MDWKERLLQWFYRVIYRRPPKWDKCSKASCWTGHNAGTRLMNILSPHMPDRVFRDRVKWMTGRECNTAHVILANEKDGEYAGYSIYGATWDWNISCADEDICQLMRERIRYLRRKGFAVVVWTLTDDGPAYNSTVDDNFEKYASDLEDQGLFDLASIVVSGLELGDYFDHSRVASHVAAIRHHYRGKVGIHQNAGRTHFAGLGDLFFAQESPGRSSGWLANRTKHLVGSLGKPVNMFEVERQEAPAKSQAMLDAGAFGVGNC